MDLLTLFEGVEHQPRLALDDLKKGMSAKDVASTHIEPNIRAIEKNAGQEMDPLYVAYLLEHVVQNSRHACKNPL